MKKMTNNKSVEDNSQTKKAEVDVAAKSKCFQSLVQAREAAVATLTAIAQYEEAAEEDRKRENARKTGRGNLYLIERESWRKQLEKDLKELRQLRGEIGVAVINLLDKAQLCLSEKEFCDACGCADKYQEVQNARAIFEQESEGDANFYFWLIFDYGLESSDEEIKSGPLFECVLRAVIEAIKHDPELTLKAREKMFGVSKFIG